MREKKGPSGAPSLCPSCGVPGKGGESLRREASLGVSPKGFLTPLTVREGALVTLALFPLQGDGGGHPGAAGQGGASAPGRELQGDVVPPRLLPPGRGHAGDVSQRAKGSLPPQGEPFFCPSSPAWPVPLRASPQRAPLCCRALTKTSSSATCALQRHLSSVLEKEEAKEHSAAAVAFFVEVGESPTPHPGMESAKQGGAEEKMGVLGPVGRDLSRFLCSERRA